MPAGSRPGPASPSLGVKTAWGGVLPLPSSRLGQLWGVGRQQVDWASRSVPRWDPGHSASPDPQPTTLTLLRPGGLHSRLAACCPGDSCLGDPPQRSPPEPTLPAEAWPELGTEASVAASGPFPGPERGAEALARCCGRACGPAARRPGTKLHLGQSARPRLQGRVRAMPGAPAAPPSPPLPFPFSPFPFPFLFLPAGLAPHLMVDPLVLGEVPLHPQLKVENQL